MAVTKVVDNSYDLYSYVEVELCPLNPKLNLVNLIQSEHLNFEGNTISIQKDQLSAVRLLGSNKKEISDDFCSLYFTKSSVIIEGVFKPKNDQLYTLQLANLHIPLKSTKALKSGLHNYMATLVPTDSDIDFIQLILDSNYGKFRQQ
ncbi:MAG: hypothetical protein GY810_32235 [Aureispira sp.]|nr:hypothetical protein [Aureispira sp.]